MASTQRSSRQTPARITGFVHSGGMRALGAVLLIFLLAACGPQADQSAGAHLRSPADLALLDAPEIGDVYAAELTQFSGASFEGQPKVYGLLKVVAVAHDTVTVITENAGSASESLARKDLLGDMDDIEFDRSEHIVIVRRELTRAYESGKIFAARR